MNNVDKNIIKKIRLYIEEKLTSEEATEIRSILQESKELFDIYIELKEALFLKKQGKPATLELKNKILDMVKTQNTPHFKFIVRFLKDTIIVTSGGQEKLDFQSLQASFSYRNDNEPGPIAINRKINGRELSIILNPIENSNEFNLSIFFNKKEKIEAVLLVNDEEVETILDLSKQKMFSSKIYSESSVDIIFNKQKKVLFTVNLKLQSEK